MAKKVVNTTEVSSSLAPKAKKAKVITAAPVPEVAPDETVFELPAPEGQADWMQLLGGLLALALVAMALVGGFELLYRGKVYPGVRAEGVYLGGLTREQAKAALATRLDQFSHEQIPVTYGNTTLRVSVAQLETKYDTDKITREALSFGRNASWPIRLHEQARALFGRSTSLSSVSFNIARLLPYLNQIDDDLNRPVANAQLNFVSGKVAVVAAKAGQRLDRGLLVAQLASALELTSVEDIEAPYYRLAPIVETTDLEGAKDQASRYLDTPLTLKADTVTQTVEPGDIINWLHFGDPHRSEITGSFPVNDYYQLNRTTTLSFDDAKLEAYVAELATHIDRPAQNAQLSIVDGKATVFVLSRNGMKLDQAGSVTAIQKALDTTGSERTVALPTAVAKAEINEDTLNNLGIKELISEGTTYFPGSPSTRLINVRAGASKMNGVLIKPGETWSFDEALGPIGPETGYVPELVILNNHEEKQYGGGLCQVSSTAYRAALLAGLPIVQRQNHSFAISYYTAPFGVPGVDATIYPPDVDLKFTNDTGSYILIQTIMKGTTLTFQYYGTKTKSGVIRGPFFVSGTTDTTQPSHTIFYRDVLDLAGNVIKTDATNTWYKSSKDFPITQQIN